MSKRQGLGIAAWRGRGALSEDRIEGRATVDAIPYQGPDVFCLSPSGPELCLLFSCSWPHGYNVFQVSHPYLGRRQEEGQGEEA